MNTYDPFAFRLPVQNVQRNDRVVVNVTYSEELEYFDGAYECHLPLKFRPEQIDEEDLARRVFITLAVNAGTLSSALPDAPAQEFVISVSSPTHALTTQQVGPTRSVSSLDNARPLPNQDLVFSYRLSAPTINGSLVVQDGNPNAVDTRSTFALFLSPPSNDYIQVSFGWRCWLLLLSISP